MQQTVDIMKELRSSWEENMELKKQVELWKAQYDDCAVDANKMRAVLVLLESWHGSSVTGTGYVDQDRVPQLCRICKQASNVITSTYKRMVFKK